MQFTNIKVRAPILMHLNNSLVGMTTIRTSNLNDTIKKEFENHLNLIDNNKLILNILLNLSISQRKK